MEDSWLMRAWIESQAEMLAGERIAYLRLRAEEAGLGWAVAEVVTRVLMIDSTIRGFHAAMRAARD